MTLIRKTKMEKHINRFEQDYQKLREVLNGTELNMNIWDQHSKNPDDHRRDFIEINPEDLSYAIADCRSSLTELAKLKIHKEPRLKSDK